MMSPDASRLLEDTVIREIHPQDTMCDPGQQEAYYNVGRSALSACLRHVGTSEVRRIIDFPSGYGRALRWFKAYWPAAELVAVETDMQALEFAATTFGAEPIGSTADFGMTIPGDADLIFSGSLVTHLDDWQWDLFIAQCVDALAPEGTFVFTVHGRVHAKLARERSPLFGDLIDTRALYDDYARDGFAYRPYAEAYPEFGLSLSKPSWIMARIEKLPFAKIVAYEEQGWGQDVVALRKNKWPLVDL